MRAKKSPFALISRYVRENTSSPLPCCPLGLYLHLRDARLFQCIFLVLISYPCVYVKELTLPAVGARYSRGRARSPRCSRASSCRAAGTLPLQQPPLQHLRYVNHIHNHHSNIATASSGLGGDSAAALRYSTTDSAAERAAVLSAVASAQRASVGRVEPDCEGTLRSRGGGGVSSL
jgi:hypothetical protein